MPDFADKAFDAANTIYQISSSVLQTVYYHAKNAADYTLDYTLENAHKLQDKSKDLWVSTSAPSAPPETTDVSRWTHYLRDNKEKIGLYGGIPLSLYAGYNIFRLFYPYKRRAEKLESGGRFEVVLVVGHLESNFVKRLIHDLNARGYIVFVTVSDEKQLRIVEDEKDDDIKPLIVDYESSVTVKASLLKLAKFLDTQVDGRFFHLRGCLFVPDYFHLPKISKMEDLSGKEFKRVLDEQFLKLNMLLASGLTLFLKESNNRRKSVEECNDVRIKGGYSKLIFVNFVMYVKNESRTLLVRLAKAMNQMLFDELHDELAPSLSTSISRLFGIDDDPSKIDMTMLSVSYKKDKESHLIGDSMILDNLPLSRVNKRLSSKDVHYKIYDLLNSHWLKSDYYIHN
ncbi:DEKNAAC104144 [Brettanomyces naardenensis]|uniref:DEKNAAC104144 n=1 Tax=Brettanomyces naardenensis TaxID=13370 RepID=A0A448YPY2_BRENA|nr:DEKNAAC104144 [Brettanomyces naardenensis]